MKITYTQCYGKACYEMSGDRYKETKDFKEFILDVLKINKHDLGGDNKIPMFLRYELVRGIVDGKFGDNYGISYEDIKMDKDKVTRKELLDVFKDINIFYGVMDSLRERTLYKLLHI